MTFFGAEQCGAGYAKGHNHRFFGRREENPEVHLPAAARSASESALLDSCQRRLYRFGTLQIPRKS
jgi:hypothetical protein